MRAMHMGGNWGANVQGFKPPLLTDAPTISAEKVEIESFITYFVDPSGVTNTLDLAKVKLTGVRLGSGVQFQQAGFWISKNVTNGDVVLEFKPSLDQNLKDISGLPGDIALSLTYIAFSDSVMRTTSGDARQLVTAVMANGSELVKTAIYTNTPTDFGKKESLAIAFSKIKDSYVNLEEAYFNFIKDENIEWLGISIAIHYQSYSNPLVTADKCPTGTKLDSGGNMTSCAFYDEDLESFINRAKARGLKIYLTLAFETSLDIDSTSSPACHTPDYKMTRCDLTPLIEPVLA